MLDLCLFYSSLSWCASPLLVLFLASTVEARVAWRSAPGLSSLGLCLVSSDALGSLFCSPRRDIRDRSCLTNAHRRSVCVVEGEHEGKGETALLKAQVFSSFRWTPSPPRLKPAVWGKREVQAYFVPLKPRTQIPGNFVNLFRGRSSVQCTWLIKPEFWNRDSVEL